MAKPKSDVQRPEIPSDMERMASAMRRLSSTSSYRVLEQRMVFDGAAVSTADQVANTDNTQTAPADAGATRETTNTQTGATDVVAAISTQAVTPSSGHEIYFVDSNVANKDQLIATIGSGAEVVEIKHDAGGLSQIASYLADKTDVSAVHILSHGDFGQIYLGSDVLNGSNIASFQNELSSIGSHLTADGDVLIYGCDVAYGSAGQQLIDQIAQYSSADVAASTDTTGASAYNGNWQLEVSTGTIETHVLDASGWDGVLAPISMTAVSGTASAAGMTLANSIKGSGITIVSATYSGDVSQAGTFTSGTGYTPNWLSYDSGIVFSTGTLGAILGPNTNGAQSTNAPGTGTDADFTACHLLEARDGAKERGLAAARWSHQHGEFAILDLEVDTAQHADAAGEGLAHVGEGYGGHGINP